MSSSRFAVILSSTVSQVILPFNMPFCSASNFLDVLIRLLSFTDIFGCIVFCSYVTPIVRVLMQWKTDNCDLSFQLFCACFVSTAKSIYSLLKKNVLFSYCRLDCCAENNMMSVFRRGVDSLQKLFFNLVSKVSN